MEKNLIAQYFEDVETTKEYDGYFYKVTDAIPCYYWLLCLMKLIKPESFNLCFAKWAASMLPEKREKFTLSLDGKTIRSTGKMERFC